MYTYLYKQILGIIYLFKITLKIHVTCHFKNNLTRLKGEIYFLITLPVWYDISSWTNKLLCEVHLTFIYLETQNGKEQLSPPHTTLFSRVFQLCKRFHTFHSEKVISYPLPVLSGRPPSDKAMVIVRAWSASTLYAMSIPSASSAPTLPV